ncbi:MAG TPA: hypothetical protein VFG14_09415 [Chthoniobacteraceae bacterium]|nr:hypothetical protein [Chthoniobacteraceae bacterium]
MNRWLLILLAVSSALASLPEGSGLASKYPQDQGIGTEPAVLVVEDFETDDLAEIDKRWSEVSNKDGKVFAWASDQPRGSGGKRSLQMTSTLGENTGGHLYQRLPRELEVVYARFYVKFASDAQYVHHFVHMGGYRPATSYPQGGAGDRPKGDERFTVGIEPYGDRGKHAAPGAWTFYAYWPEMKISADKRYWGNSIPPVQPAVIPHDRWQCVEIMMKCNSEPELADGELALWIDGKVANHVKAGTARADWTGMGFRPLPDNAPGATPFEGFRWRTHPDLKINFFWLLFYVTENAGRQNGVTPEKQNRVWFDDIVVATEYVGPTKAR